MALEVVSGWTGPIDLTLLEDGAAKDLTGAADVSLRLFDNVQTLVVFDGDFSVQIAASGTVRFEPVVTDLIEARSPYTARVRLTDAVGDVTYFPSSAADIWTVRPESK